MTRQEVVDGVAEVLGIHPGVETQIHTIMLLVDAYAQTYASQAVIVARAVNR